jgi:regulatory protein
MLESTSDDEEGDTRYRAALDSAVRSLSQREHGRRELERKLVRKGHPAGLVGRVLDELSEAGLQSDSRFVEVFVRSRLQKGYGPLKIRQELAVRGIAETDAEPGLTELGEFWIELAERALDRKFGAPPEGRDDWNVQARFLARRGFPSDLIYRILGSQSD